MHEPSLNPSRDSVPRLTRLEVCAATPLFRALTPFDEPLRHHAQLDGFDLHASVSVPAIARDRLEQLLRYCARPAISHDRLELLGAGRVQLELKTPRYDGTTHLVLTAHEFVERLVAVIPRPQKNLILYTGVLAPRSRLRARVCAYGRATSSAAARLAHARAQHPILPQRPTLPTRQAGARGRA